MERRRLHTAASWARTKHQLHLHGLQQSVEALGSETTRLGTLGYESHEMIGELQARFTALATAVSELPAVFQQSVSELAEGQAKVEADLVHCRQYTRAACDELRELFRDVRETCTAAAEARVAPLSERIGRIEAEQAVLGASLQQLTLAATSWEQQERRLRHVEARVSAAHALASDGGARLEHAEALLSEHAQQLLVVAGASRAMELEWERRRAQADADAALLARLVAEVGTERNASAQRVATVAQQAEAAREMASGVKGVAAQHDTELARAASAAAKLGGDVRQLRADLGEELASVRTTAGRTEALAERLEAALASHEGAMAKQLRALEQRCESVSYSVKFLGESVHVAVPIAADLTR